MALGSGITSSQLHSPEDHELGDHQGDEHKDHQCVMNERTTRGRRHLRHLRHFQGAKPKQTTLGKKTTGNGFAVQ